MLPPHEFQAFLFGQILLDRVVGPLDEHGVHADALQDVGHGGTHAEWIYSPAVATKKSSIRLQTVEITNY